MTATPAGASTLLLKNLAFTVFVPGVVAGYVPFSLVQGASLTAGVAQWCGGALMSFGCAVYGWCLWDFAVTGRGTPAPIDPPRVLVVRGLYRWSRNPMYVGVLSVIAGWALIFRSLPVLGYGIVVALAFQTFVMLYEEPHLARVFGPSYQAYRQRVRRWLGVRR